MSQADDDLQISESGGTMRRLPASPDPSPTVDLDLLESFRRRDHPGPFRPAGSPPYLVPGEVMTWHYGWSAEPMRVVRDDPRGLVAWLAPASEVLLAVPVDGRGRRDRPPSERMRVPLEMRLQHWQGPGILRVAPTGAPWSVWFFWHEAGEFEGHYVNLELTHERPASGEPRTYTRDLTLDLWLDADGELWLKDEDELEAAVQSGLYDEAQADAVRAIAGLARRELVEARGWPLDEGWETWRPSGEFCAPLSLPAHAARRAGERPPPSG